MIDDILTIPAVLGSWFWPLTSPEARLIAFTVLAIAIAWGALFLWDRHRKQAALTANDSRGLFESLCAAHHLSDAEREFLRRVVAGRHAAQPAVVFVDPRHLREAGSRPGISAAECNALRQRLFGDAAASAS